MMYSIYCRLTSLPKYSSIRSKLCNKKFIGDGASFFSKSRTQTPGSIILRIQLTAVPCKSSRQPYMHFSFGSEKTSAIASSISGMCCEKRSARHFLGNIKPQFSVCGILPGQETWQLQHSVQRFTLGNRAMTRKPLAIPVFFFGFFFGFGFLVMHS